MAMPPETPTCPFCEAPWTATMLEQLERHSSGAFCACCEGPPQPRHGASLPGLPLRDLCCESCGKPIYLAPAGAGKNVTTDEIDHA